MRMNFPAILPQPEIDKPSDSESSPERILRAHSSASPSGIG